MCIHSYSHSFLQSRQAQGRVKSEDRVYKNIGWNLPEKQKRCECLSLLPLRKTKVNKAKCKRQRRKQKSGGRLDQTVSNGRDSKGLHSMMSRSTTQDRSLTFLFSTREKKCQSWRHYVRKKFIKLWQVEAVESRIYSQLCVMKLTSQDFSTWSLKGSQSRDLRTYGKLFTSSAHTRTRVMRPTQYLEEISSSCILYK